MRYFDAHCHVQFPQYDEDRDHVLARMHDQEVGGLLVGTNRAMSEAALALADGNTLFASIGLHPNHVKDEWMEIADYERMARDPKVVAIGECGLDYFRPEDAEAAKVEQKRVFLDHVRIAEAVGKPLMVHARPSKGTNDSYEDALAMLAEHPGVRANFHFFVGSPEMGKRIVALGHTCSFTAVLTFTHDYDELIRKLPLESIITETDAPYAAPLGNRGKRNEPGAVIEVVKAIARIRGEDEEAVRQAVLDNAAQVFGIPVA